MQAAQGVLGVAILFARHQFPNFAAIPVAHVAQMSFHFGAFLGHFTLLNLNLFGLSSELRRLPAWRRMR